MATGTKNRKPQSSRSNPTNYSQMYKSAAAGVSVSDVIPAASSATATRQADQVSTRAKTSDEVDWTHEYSYVLKDLRRLGLVTVALIIAIIVAGIFI